MDSIAQIRVAHNLKEQGFTVAVIAKAVGRHRATIYRWLQGIERYGLEGFVQRQRNAKKGRRVRKVHPYVVQRVLTLRREYRDCCGQKIAHLLRQEGILLSVSTVYRILNKYLRPLRKHTRTARGQPAQRGYYAGEVVQMDTLALGALYAFTAIDTYTKQAVVVIRPGLTAEDGRLALEEVARRLGPIRVLQTDGGSEFEKDFAAAVPLYAQEHVIARPYRKNDQAFIECFNGTLRREEFGRTPFKASDLALAQQRADAFLDYYHHRRPHLALGMKTPAQFIAESHLR